MANANAMIDEKYNNFLDLLKNGSKSNDFKEYENREVLMKMVINYCKPAYMIGQLEFVGASLCSMLGIDNCCSKKKAMKYLEFFCQIPDNILLPNQ